MSLQVLFADCKRAVASLKDLTNDELDEIMNNDEKLENIIAELDQSYLKEIENEKENILASNNSMAEFNLSREPDLAEKREKLEENSKIGEEIYQRVEEKTKDLKQKAGDVSLETTLALLQTAASEMEEASDALAKRFLENEVEIDDFLDQFLERRKHMHTRLVKAEKMAKLLSRDPTLGGTIPTYPNPPPVSINSNYFPGIPTNPIPNPSVPYPTGPLPMPMPMPGMDYFQNHF